MDRKTKLRKLNTFRRKLPHVTASALSAILIAVASYGVPEGSSQRGALRAGRDLEITEDTPYGPILQTFNVLTKADVPKQLPFAHPFASLWTAVSACEPFGTFLQQQLLQKPPTVDSPWNLVLYSDEVTPGNPLSTNNKRKFHAIYWSFLELGANALSREESWFCIVSEYSTWINTIHAGLSQAFAAVIKTFFEPGGFDMQHGGINLPFATGDIRLWAKLGVVIQDGGAHKSVWSSRGDSASKFCLLCKNLFTSSSRICDQDGANLLVCDKILLDELEPATDADLRTNARFLEAKSATMEKDAFIELQQSMGMTHHKLAVLLDRSLDQVLRPTEVYMHDWMHTLYVDGVVNLSVYLLFEAFINKNMKNIYQAFSDYVSNWQWPSRLHGANLAEIFSDSRRDKHRSASHIKCQASDLLSLTPVLSLFVQKVLLPTNLCNAECLAFLALADVVDIIISSSRNNVKAETLLAQVHRFLHNFVIAFGMMSMIPKCHWLLHLPECLLRFGILLNCFVLERKHRIAKRYATELTNIAKGSSKYLLSEIQSHHFGQLREPNAFCFHVGLIGGRKVSRRARQLILEALECEDDEDYDIQVAKESRFNRFATCCVGDVVLLKDCESFRAGKIQLHCSVEGEFISIITCFDLVLHEADYGYAVWKPRAGSDAFSTSDILDTVAYTELPDGSVGTLLPVDYR